jgi:hypothetical protein
MASEPEDPTQLTIEEAGRQIRSGRLSPVELTHAYLARIEKHNAAINAFITTTADIAVVQARELEAELARDHWRGPLHGIPVALKDNIDTAGIRTTAASALFAERVPEDDATVVRKLRDAGVVFLGKLNMHEFAYGATSAGFELRPRSESVEPGVFTGWILWRCGCGGGGALVRRSVGHGHGRVDSHARCILRCRRTEGDAWPREHPGYSPARGDA